MKTLCSILSCLVLLINYGMAAVNYPVEDSFVYLGSPTSNFGTEDLVKIKAFGGNNREGYLKFNISNVGPITSAKLRLNARMVAAPGVDLTLWSVSDTNWGETSITWNNAPGFDDILGGFTVTTTYAWYEFDVTAYITSQQVGGNALVSFGLSTTNGVNEVLNVRSREAAQDNPELVLVTFVDTDSLTTGRDWHTATLLPSGKVLVAGGSDSSVSLTSAQLYNPSNDTWENAASMNVARSGHTATLLANGKVLVAGGWNGNVLYVSSAEIYNPANDSWTTTASLGSARQYHSATLLPSGKVLVAGGWGNSGTTSSAELFDPSGNSGAGTWASTASMSNSRRYQQAQLLTNGTVMVIAGYSAGVVSSTEIYDPAGGGGSGSWSSGGSLSNGRYIFASALLTNGHVLAIGGWGAGAAYLTSVEEYTPGSGWSGTGSLATGRRLHTATVLGDGRVFVVGGDNGSGTIANAETFNAGTWSLSGTLKTSRKIHTTTLLQDGRTLVTAGYNSVSGLLSSAELYVP